MAILDMAVVLDGVRLPDPSTPYERIFDPNETDRTTLGGKRFTDFINLQRSWTLNWKLIKETDYTIIYNIFIKQYQTGIYPMLQFDAYGIYTAVKIEIDKNQKIKYNGSLIENFSITLKEQDAFS